HPDEPVPGAVHTRVRPHAVIEDLELDRRRFVADDHLRLGPTGVLERVRERLLHDSVGGEIDAGRQWHRLALDAQVDAQARVAYLSEQRVQRPEARLWRGRRVLLASAEYAEQPPQLDERLPAGGFDGVERVAQPVRFREQPRPGLR